MLFSVATGYALRALAALPEDGSFRLTKDLAEALDLPKPYLSKVLGVLAHEGLLESVRGRRGGFRLAFPADRIAVGDVVRILEGSERSTCEPCPFHEIRMAMKAQLDWLLATVTVSDLRAWNPKISAGLRAGNSPGRPAANVDAPPSWVPPDRVVGARARRAPA